jgi:hypothetical protein
MILYEITPTLQPTCETESLYAMNAFIQNNIYLVHKAEWMEKGFERF